jgi:hypothetical protein
MPCGKIGGQRKEGRKEGGKKRQARGDKRALEMEQAAQEEVGGQEKASA